MPDQEANWEVAQPLLPSDSEQDRPLFVILVILAFLATLTLLGVKSSYSTASAWRAEIKNTVTVQVIPSANENVDELSERTRELLLAMDDVETVSVLPSDYSKSLLEPWLGDTPLPEGLNLPVLLSVNLKPENNFEAARAEASLKNAGIAANLDDNQRWDDQYKKSVRALQALSILTFVLISLAILAAVIFATRAGLSGRRMLINVLHQVGADPTYTARLFGTRFAKTGFKAGALGAIGAILVLLVLGILTSGLSGNFQFLPDIKSGPANFVLALFIPVFIAIIAGVTAWRTVLKTLYEQVYP